MGAVCVCAHAHALVLMHTHALIPLLSRCGKLRKNRTPQDLIARHKCNGCKAELVKGVRGTSKVCPGKSVTLYPDAR